MEMLVAWSATIRLRLAFLDSHPSFPTILQFRIWNLNARGSERFQNDDPHGFAAFRRAHFQTSLRN